MTKLILTDVTNLENENTAVATLASNNDATVTAVENTLSRDGTSPNQMNAQLDMNSNRIINLPAPSNLSDPVRLGDITSSTNPILTAAPGGVVFGGGGGVFAQNATSFFWDDTLKSLQTGTATYGGNLQGGLPGLWIDNGTLTVSTGNVNLPAFNQGGIMMGMPYAKNQDSALGGGAYGTLKIFSNDAFTAPLNEHYLQSTFAQQTSPTAALRRLTLSCIEQGTAFRNVTINEQGGNLGVGSGATTPIGTLHVVLPDASATFNTAWDATYSVFGKATATGGGLGIGYSTAGGAVLASVLPGTAFKTLTMYASAYAFNVGGTSESIIGSGLQIGAPTGGAKGVGTFNATAGYINNVAVIDLSSSQALTNKTYNGNTWTSGTGTLTLGAGKTTTISNTVTLTATDGSTLAIGSGGTLGTNAYTSTAYAPLASPAFTGVPTAPTAAVDTNTTQLATTAMVLAQAASATPLINGSATVGTSTRFARGDHVHPVDTTRAPLASPTFTGTTTIPGITLATSSAINGGIWINGSGTTIFSGGTVGIQFNNNANGVANITIADSGATTFASSVTALLYRSGVAPTAVSGAGPILTGSGSTINSRMKVNLNGTDYWIPCSTTAF